MSSTSLYSGYGRQNVPDQRRISSRRQRLPSCRVPEAGLHEDRRDRSRLLAGEDELSYSLGGESVSGNPSTPRTNDSSGSAPRISIDSLTIVFGTPVTRNFRDRSMNSVASTQVARMCSAFDSHPMRERHGSRAVRASRRDEDLDVERCGHVRGDERATVRRRAENRSCRPG